HTYRRFVPLLFLIMAASLQAADQPTCRHEAYIWQRQWNDSVRDAIREATPTLDGFIALGAEVAWRDGQRRIVHVPVDQPGKPTGIALRIGAYRGAFDKDTGWLTSVAAELV